VIISRYLRKGILTGTFGVAILLSLVVLSNQFAALLGRVAHGKLAKSAVLYIVGLSFPGFLALLLPISLFVTLYFLLTRLYADHEMVVIQMCGVSQWAVMRIIAGPVLLIGCLAMLLNLWVVPHIFRYRDWVLDKAQVFDAVGMLAAGHFQVLEQGRYVLYVAESDTDHRQFSHIFFARHPDVKPSDVDRGPHIDSDGDRDGESDGESDIQDVPQLLAVRQDIFLSRGGSRRSMPEFNQEHFIVMDAGSHYQGIPGQLDFVRMKFQHYGVHLPEPEIRVSEHVRAQRSVELWARRAPEFQAELHGRLGFGLAPFVLALLALAASHLFPRQNRFGRVFPALLMVLVYYVCLMTGRNWIEQGFVPTGVGLWWVHIMGLCIAAWMLVRRA
jgi:lipopolysaccharide export system permease protein